jgi:hypothetical protein
MAEIFDLDVTDGDNTGRFPEGQAPSTVNNGARALEGLLARGLKDTINPNKTTTGSANAQALTPNATVATLTAGMMFTWKAGYTNTAAMTLNVADTAATGAKSVKTTNGSDPWAGAVTVGGYYTTIYDGTKHVLLNPSGIGDGAVTLAKMADLAQDKLIGRATASTGVPEAVGLDATLAMDTGNLKVVDASETQKGAVELSTQAEAETGTDATRAITPLTLRQAFRATGTAPVYACRAWVNFNGTGTVAIRASGNVSSITDNGIGRYTINFATEMPDANYSAIASEGEGVFPSTTGNDTGIFLGEHATTSVKVYIVSYAEAATDKAFVSVAIFR